MSRDKQIEEMAKLIQFNYECPFSFAEGMAEFLHYEGYRKASDLAEEIFAEIEKEIELALDSNYKVKRDAQDMNDGLVIYVEGKIDCLRGLLGFIAELKKKYTEEGK